MKLTEASSEVHYKLQKRFDDESDVQACEKSFQVDGFSLVNPP
jgi:hypothetical protein